MVRPCKPAMYITPKYSPAHHQLLRSDPVPADKDDDDKGYIGDDVDRTESKDGGRRQQWGPVVRTGSFVSDGALPAASDQSE
ncbi:unnamed protein product [Plutella xylostella]|uniref:(diamondback moth) hypothetical protein n=1 Tax=Plutella xylostella TaxID=51655 RepID=A0A8S4FYJ5_PLUXY|nr:unnamed protein product [Plutella xylostella]